MLMYPYFRRLSFVLLHNQVFCLFDLWLSIPVNSYSHVGMLPPMGHLPNILIVGCPGCAKNNNHPRKQL